MSVGKFIHDGASFLIQEREPRRPLYNYLWNDECVSCLDQFGFGSTQSRADGEFRQLAFGERLLFIKEKDLVYAANRNYDRLPFTSWGCEVGLGYQKIVSEYQGLRVSFTIRLAKKGSVELHEVEIENVSKETHEFALVTYLRPFINITVHVSYGHAEKAQGFEGIEYSYDAFHSPFPHSHIFYATDHKVKAYEASVRNFTGTYGDIRHPEALLKDHLGSHPVTFEGEYAGALEIPLSLRPGEKETIHFVLGLSTSHADSLQKVEKFLSKQAFQEAKEVSTHSQKEYENAFYIRSGDPYDDALLNYWLKRQIDLGKSWGRVYGKGFRDIMQDTACFVCFDSNLARQRIIDTLAYQYENGNCLRQFDPVFDHPYFDGACWIPQTVLSYLNETADTSILEEIVPYYESKKNGSILDHLEKGLEFLLNHRGKHNLVLWGGGDWNDSIDNAGIQMIGESVWLSIASVKAINDFEEILELTKKETRLSHLSEKKQELIDAIWNYGFEEDHFIYGYNDKGEKVGSSESKEGKYFLNPQSWAVLAKIVKDEKARKLLSKADESLLTPYGYMQNTDPYTTGDEGIGRLSYFYPGLYENGSVYNHGSAFMMAAQLEAGLSKEALHSWHMMRPDNPSNPNNGMEPYAIANMYIGPGCPFLAGYAPLSWVTGTAGWIYHNLTEGVYGIKPTFAGLMIRPKCDCIEKEIVIHRRFRGENYEIHLLPQSLDSLTCDGVSLKIDEPLPLTGDGSVHLVFRTMKKAVN